MASKEPNLIVLVFRHCLRDYGTGAPKCNNGTDLTSDGAKTKFFALNDRL